MRLIRMRTLTGGRWVVSQFRLLGPIEVEVDRRLLYVGEPRQRAVLAILLFDAQHVVRVETLVDRVWGDHPPAKARETLRPYLTRIRRLLHDAQPHDAQPHDAEPAQLTHHPGGYRLDVDPERIDLHRFDRLVDVSNRPTCTKQRQAALLRQALELWRGEALTGIRGGWADRTRDRLARKRLDVIAAWAHAELQIGNASAVLSPLFDLADEHPAVEPLTVALVHALVAVGRPTDALDQCRRHRQRLADEYGTDQSTELRMLYTAILRGDLDHQQAIVRNGAMVPSPASPEEHPDHQAAITGGHRRPDQAGDGVVSAPPKAERTLPADVTDFVGRHDELRSLIATVTDRPVQTIAIHAVDGMAGIGKTAFAIHAAHRLAAQFPDGQRFVALRAHAPGQTPVDPASALEILLQADGVAAQQIPTSLDARAGLWRDRMAAKRLLLVLDDAADASHVAPLLPGASGCVVLITSRRKLTTLPGTAMLSLEILRPDHAAQLFIGRAGRGDDDPAAVGRITGLCGYLPLAITLTAARLHTHPTWTITDLADDLAAARDRLAELASGELAVAAAFDLSYRDLPADRKRLFRRLGIHPGPDFDAYAAAALDHTTLTAARRGLEDLLEHNLIMEPHRGRYRFHDLIAEHASALAATDPSAEQEASLDRLLDFYLNTATVAAGRLTFQPTFPKCAASPGAAHAEVPALTTCDQATAWFTQEQPNLVAAAGSAATHHRIQAAVGIPDALHEHLRLIGPWTLAIQLHHTALAAARYASDQPGQAITLTNLADTQHLIGDHTAAAATVGQAFDLFRRLGDQHGQASALNLLGCVRYRTGDFLDAATTAEQALDVSLRLGDQRNQAYALHTLGLIRYVAGDYPAAARVAGQALDVSLRLGDERGQADILNTLGLIRYVAGDYPAAAGVAGQALDVARRLGDQRGQTNALNTLGRVRFVTGAYPAAADTAGQVLELSRRLGSRLGEANALQTLGRVRRATADYTAAAAALRQALDLFGAAEDPDGQAETLNDLGELLLTSATPAAARQQFTAALGIARTIGTPSHEARALEGLGNCALCGGRHDEGTTYLRQALAIYQRINSPRAARVEATLRKDGR